LVQLQRQQELVPKEMVYHQNGGQGEAPLPHKRDVVGANPQLQLSTFMLLQVEV